MSTEIAELTQLLLDIATRDLTDTNDFVSLALTGEALHRAANALGGDGDPALHESAQRALEAYQARLSAIATLAPEGLETDLGSVLAELAQYAALPVYERTVAHGVDLLAGIDEVLEVARAAARVGRLTSGALESLGESARSAVRSAAPDLADLWQAAEDRQLQRGPDPDAPGLYAWIEELARLAPSRLATQLAAGLLSDTTRQRLIQRALALLTERADARAAGHGSGARVIRVAFRRQSAEPLRAAADGGALEQDHDPDPARTGTVVRTDEADGIEVRVGETNGPSGGSLAAIRIRLLPDSNLDLSQSGAVIVRDGAGRELTAFRSSERMRLLWWGEFVGDGPFTVEIPTKNIAVTVAIDRQGEGAV